MAEHLEVQEEADCPDKIKKALLTSFSIHSNGDPERL